MALRYNDRSRRLSDDAEVFSYALRQNPLLTAAAGTAVVAGGCTSLGNAVILCIMMVILLPLIGFISAVEQERIRPHLRLAAYCAISAVVVFLISLAIDGMVLGSVEELGIFAPLVAFSSLVLARTSEDAPILTRREAVHEGFAYAVAFIMLALPVGLIREVLGKGEIFGGWLGFSGKPQFSKPWFGFILCGLAIAVIRRATDKPERTLTPTEAEEAEQ